MLQVMESQNTPTFRPNPGLKLMDQVREILRHYRYAYRLLIHPRLRPPLAQRNTLHGRPRRVHHTTTGVEGPLGRGDVLPNGTFSTYPPFAYAPCRPLVAPWEPGAVLTPGNSSWKPCCQLVR